MRSKTFMAGRLPAGNNEHPNCDRFSTHSLPTHKETVMATTNPTDDSEFPIPASLQDLEREPYNLLPYPHDFDDDDEAARADSFCRLVDLIDQGNQVLLAEGMSVFEQYEGQTRWLQNDRIQALYTLVRYESSALVHTQLIWKPDLALTRTFAIFSIDYLPLQQEHFSFILDSLGIDLLSLSNSQDSLFHAGRRWR